MQGWDSRNNNGSPTTPPPTEYLLSLEASIEFVVFVNVSFVRE